jgi:RNA polymerase sigma factor (sigma-70 family)
MPASSKSSQSNSAVDRIVQLYGDLIFDLCESVLWDPHEAQTVFRAVLKDIRTALRGNRYTDYERPWILRIAFERLRKVSRQSRKVTASEQIQMDASQNVAARLKQFEMYFHRLATEDQMLLLLRDKYGLPYPEIASAIGLPEGSLKQQRQQALRSLDDWIWAEGDASSAHGNVGNAPALNGGAE